MKPEEERGESGGWDSGRKGTYPGVAQGREGTKMRRLIKQG